MPEIITRKEAIARGLKWYFTGNPCKRGHVCERYTCNRNCRTCIICFSLEWGAKNIWSRNAAVRKWLSKNKNRDRAYKQRREWGTKNRDKIQEYNLLYWKNGPPNPRTELQWLRKNQALLRKLKRILKHQSAGRQNGPNEAFPI